MLQLENAVSSCNFRKRVQEIDEEKIEAHHSNNSRRRGVDVHFAWDISYQLTGEHKLTEAEGIPATEVSPARRSELCKNRALLKSAIDLKQDLAHLKNHEGLVLERNAEDKVIEIQEALDHKFGMVLLFWSCRMNNMISRSNSWVSKKHSISL